MIEIFKKAMDRLYIFRPVKKLPKLKEKRFAKHLLYAHPLLISIMFDMAWYCERNEIPFNITSVIRSPEQNKAVGAVSMSHVFGRAFDLSTKDWNAFEIDTFLQFFNKKYRDHAAISMDGKPRLVVYHQGTSWHLHIQIHSKYSKKDAWKQL